MTDGVPRHSCGILLHRVTGESIEVLLVHPGGPLWAQRDLGAWSIPKGEIEEGEAPFDAARREFGEELGSPAPDGEPIELGEVTLKSGKRVWAWALAGDLDVDRTVSDTFELQWPPRSGRVARFPEVDRAQWFAPADARRRLNPAQVAFVDRLVTSLDAG
jgi:predicted NUDIX family NTP pyrophosphohydrolase